MGAELSLTREEEFLIERDLFRRNAFLVINQMVRVSPGHPSNLVDEILHSIFFLGKIKNPPYSPERIVSDGDMLRKLQLRYPNPFRYYSSQLPRRSPISCVLDMIVDLMGQEKEDEIIKRLQELILHLKKGDAKDLVSSTICVSQRDKTGKTVRYYGVSMSTSGCNPGRIMVAASCLNNWDSYVADAVMTYYPSTEKNEDFDGTIQLPEQVRCEAFNITDGRKKPPCRSCGNLFGLTTDETKEWVYGNCAEPESLSNLFKKERDVRDQARPTSLTYTDQNREEVKKAVMNKLTSYLKQVGFKWNNNFYTPQAG